MLMLKKTWHTHTPAAEDADKNTYRVATSETECACDGTEEWDAYKKHLHPTPITMAGKCHYCILSERTRACVCVCVAIDEIESECFWAEKRNSMHFLVPWISLGALFSARYRPTLIRFICTHPSRSIIIALSCFFLILSHQKLPSARSPPTWFMHMNACMHATHIHAKYRKLWRYVFAATKGGGLRLLRVLQVNL